MVGRLFPGGQAFLAAVADLLPMSSHRFEEDAFGIMGKIAPRHMQNHISNIFSLTGGHTGAISELLQYTVDVFNVLIVLFLRCLFLVFVDFERQGLLANMMTVRKLDNSR